MVSFATVGAIWLAHNAVTHYLHHTDPLLLRLNLLLLLVVSFLPFPTRLLAESVEDEDAGKVATTFYGLTLLTATVLVSVLWRYAVHERLVHPDASDDEVAGITKKLAPGLGFYVVMSASGTSSRSLPSWDTSPSRSSTWSRSTPSGIGTAAEPAPTLTRVHASA